MYIVVNEQAIVDFLSKYNIDYYMLSTDAQSLICVLSNMLFLLFWAVVFYILYRVFMRIIDRWF